MNEIFSIQLIPRESSDIKKKKIKIFKTKLMFEINFLIRLNFENDFFVHKKDNNYQ